MYWLGFFKVNIFEIFLLCHHHVCLNSEKSLYLYINNGLFYTNYFERNFLSFTFFKHNFTNNFVNPPKGQNDVNQTILKNLWLNPLTPYSNRYLTVGYTRILLLLLSNLSRDLSQIEDEKDGQLFYMNLFENSLTLLNRPGMNSHLCLSSSPAFC